MLRKRLSVLIALSSSSQHIRIPQQNHVDQFRFKFQVMINQLEPQALLLNPRLESSRFYLDLEQNCSKQKGVVWSGAQGLYECVMSWNCLIV